MREFLVGICMGVAFLVVFVAISSGMDVRVITAALIDAFACIFAALGTIFGALCSIGGRIGSQKSSAGVSES